jgi:hypothetical protein
MEKISVPTHKQFMTALTTVSNGIDELRKPLTTVSKVGGKQFAKIATPINGLLKWSENNETVYNEAVKLLRTGARATKTRAASN